MKNLRIGILLFLLLFYNCGSKSEPVLYVAASANTQSVTRELIRIFEEKWSLPCELIVGSSGKLTTQITAGAPYNVFLSADMKYPQYLFDRAIALEKPLRYADGQLIIWSKSVDPITFEKLLHPDVEKIAIANPKIAPYGKAAMQVFSFYGIRDSIASKIIYAESIAQVNQFVETGVVDAGFTAKSTIFKSNHKIRGSWVPIPQKGYDTIRQGVVVIRQELQKDSLAKQFRQFLFSTEARKIFKDFGYLVP